MNEHVTDYLSDYVDDELASADRVAVDAHIAACAACATELDAMRRLVAHAATVPDHDVPPARDLWGGILRRIEQPGGVRPFTSAAGRTRMPGVATADAGAAARRISLSLPQLAAAAVLLMAVSGTAAWMLRDRLASTPAIRATAIEAEVEAIGPAPDARLVNFADAQYDAAVSDLERALEERRNDLNPRTVEILERNLTLIDAAIAQARQALEEDPGNMYLNRHLVDSRRRKLDLLRRAAAITEGD